MMMMPMAKSRATEIENDGWPSTNLGKWLRKQHSHSMCPHERKPRAEPVTVGYGKHYVPTSSSSPQRPELGNKGRQETECVGAHVPHQVTFSSCGKCRAALAGALLPFQKMFISGSAPRGLPFPKHPASSASSGKAIIEMQADGDKAEVRARCL
jgi:hypothetical protein